MAGTLPPGIGNPQQAMQATAFIRQQPWYQQFLQSTGRDPNAVDTNGNPLQPFNEQEQNQLLGLARQNGIGISDSYHIDQNGQIADVPSHVLRNILIGAGIGGAALTGLGAFGIGPLSGLLGSGATAAGAADGATNLGFATMPEFGTAAAEGATAPTLGISATLPEFGTAAADAAASAPTLGYATLPAFGSAAGGAFGGAAGAAGSGAGAATTGAGGTSAASSVPNWLKSAQDVGQVLSGLENGRAQGRAMDSFVNNQYANAATNLYNSELTAPQKIAQNAVRGDVLSNARDVAFGGVPSDIPVPTISGGLRPSMFSDTTRQLGKNMTSAAANTPMPTPAPPALPPPQGANGLDTTLNTAALIAGLAPGAANLATQIPWGRIF